MRKAEMMERFAQAIDVVYVSNACVVSFICSRYMIRIKGTTTFVFRRLGNLRCPKPIWEIHTYWRGATGQLTHQSTFVQNCVPASGGIFVWSNQSHCLGILGIRLRVMVLVLTAKLPDRNSLCFVNTISRVHWWVCCYDSFYKKLAAISSVILFYLDF